MHRIDGPGATVDNRFTDGDPVAGIQATMVTDDWANDIQEELMSLLTAAGISPVKGTQNQVLAALRSLSPGIIGSMRNARMSVIAASTVATFTVDQVVVGSSLGGATYRLNGFNKAINLGGTGAGGMDTGTAPVSGFVGLYAIYNPTTSTSALLAVNATSALLPNVYGGANMPAGYTASALVSVWPTSASGQFVVGLQTDREIGISSNIVLTTTTPQASLTSLSISAAVPRNAIMFRGDITMMSSLASSGLNSVISGSPLELGRFGVGINSQSAGTGITISYPDIQILTPQTLYYRVSISSGTLNYVVGVAAYSI